jgi:hypothetical protein
MEVPEMALGSDHMRLGEAAEVVAANLPFLRTDHDREQDLGYDCVPIAAGTEMAMDPDRMHGTERMELVRLRASVLEMMEQAKGLDHMRDTGTMELGTRLGKIVDSGLAALATLPDIGRGYVLEVQERQLWCSRIVAQKVPGRLLEAGIDSHRKGRESAHECMSRSVTGAQGRWLEGGIGSRPAAQESVPEYVSLVVAGAPGRLLEGDIGSRPAAQESAHECRSHSVTGAQGRLLEGGIGSRPAAQESAPEYVSLVVMAVLGKLLGLLVAFWKQVEAILRVGSKVLLMAVQVTSFHGSRLTLSSSTSTASLP